MLHSQTFFINSVFGKNVKLHPNAKFLALPVYSRGSQRFVVGGPRNMFKQNKTHFGDPYTNKAIQVLVTLILLYHTGLGDQTVSFPRPENETQWEDP